MEPHGPEITTAMDRWEDLAACAWAGFIEHGRGALLLEQEELRHVHAEAEAGRRASLSPTYLPADAIPKGDDFRSLMMQYDPERMILLITRDTTGEELALTIAADDEKRKTPKACYDAVADG